jgi:hypothetical protein
MDYGQIIYRERRRVMRERRRLGLHGPTQKDITQPLGLPVHVLIAYETGQQPCAEDFYRAAMAIIRGFDPSQATVAA